MAGCSEPAVNASLLLPDRHLDWDTQCVGAVDVYATGSRYPSDPLDFEFACVPVANITSFADIRAAIDDKVVLSIPESGLRTLDVIGRSGSCALGSFETMTAVFTAAAVYDGSGGLALRMTPAASCGTKPQTIRVLRLSTLLATRDCAAALLANPADPASVRFGALSPLSIGPSFFTSHPSAALSSGIATSPGPAVVDRESCPGALAGTAREFNLACISGEHRVCATGAEYESAVIDQAELRTSLDPDKLVGYGGAILGSVWALTEPRAPVAGATVQLGDLRGEVVYVEQAGTGVRPLVGATATGASGLFVVYTDAIGEITVSTPRGARRVKVASGGDVAVTLIGI